MQALSRWIARPDVPNPLPGEDRSFGSGLFVDLVPSSCWFTNVRSCVDVNDWDRLRRMVYGRVDHRCEICGAAADRERSLWLEAHERWDYDTRHRTQHLKRLVCLCTMCHQSTHFGFAQVKGREAAALQHLMTVNGWDRLVAQHHVDEAFALWRKRSEHDWQLDLSILTNAGIGLMEPPSAPDRRGIAARGIESTEPQRVEPPPAAAPLPSAGWYPDPAGRLPHRWWDGTGWTDHVVNRFGDHFDNPL